MVMTDRTINYCCITVFRLILLIIFSWIVFLLPGNNYYIRPVCIFQLGVALITSIITIIPIITIMIIIIITTITSIIIAILCDCIFRRRAYPNKL